MVEFRNLETFVWVARLASFRLAADRLGATQPAISARIALVEQELGVRLFERQPRRVVLTAQGVELFGHAERMLALRDEMVQAVGQASALGGRLRMGVPETIVHTFLAALVEQIAVQHPGITLDIEVDATTVLRAALMADRLDIIFDHIFVDDPLLSVEALCDFPLGWFASPALDLPAEGVTLAQCCARPIITHRRGSSPYAAVRQVLVEAGLGKARIFSSSAISAIVRLARDGIGVCVVPEAVVVDELAAGELRRLDVACALPPVNFYVCTRVDAVREMPAVVARLAMDIAQGRVERPEAASKRSIEHILK
jgi:DNA-binding transcriptional LysR family regulator